MYILLVYDRCGWLKWHTIVWRVFEMVKPFGKPDTWTVVFYSTCILVIPKCPHVSSMLDVFLCSVVFFLAFLFFLHKRRTFLEYFMVFTYVWIIPYFRLLVFGILVTLVCDLLSVFFSSFLSGHAKSKQRLHNIFVTSLPKVIKNQNRKMGWTKH